MKKRSIVWFRSDLRIHDNESLVEAVAITEEVLPVYVFDERMFMGETSYGFKKTGIRRTAFLIEAVTDLRKRLQEKGNDLYVAVGKPEEILVELCSTYQASWVICNRERTREESEVQDALEQKLWSFGREVRYNRGKMLYYTADLPFPVTHTPDTFTNFRKEVERFIPIREPFQSPEAIPSVSEEIDYGTIPSLTSLGYSTLEVSDTDANKFQGGETAGLQQLNYYLWESDLVADYKNTRNEMEGWEYSTKFSPWLAHGCLSPKMVYSELIRYEKERVKNESTYWVFFELLWRDFFRLMGKKHGDKIFLESGPREINKEWSDDKFLFDRWASGQTGIPLVDACMRQLNDTGFISNRGRQNAASFLVNELKINWIMGAEYFESKLVDYDPCSNYGNWNYIAGIGSDPRENRIFNIVSQTKKYDPKGTFIKKYLPELNAVPVEYIDFPTRMPIDVQKEVGCIIGKDYPKALVNLVD